jgi:Fe-S cluster assembly protein SufD
VDAEMTQLADEQAAKSSTGDSWVDELRRRGAARFESVGYPSPKEEEWRFTQLAPITRAKFRPAGRESHGKLVADTVREFSFGKEAASELVFVNGYFEPQLSGLGKLSLGVRATNLATAFSSDCNLVRQHLSKHARLDGNPFVAMNTSSLRDGALVQVGRGMAIEHPIHLLFVSTSTGGQPTVSYPRVLIVLEPAAQASIVESYCGAGDGLYLTNAVTEVVAGPGTQLDHCKLQQESLSAFHVAAMQVELNRSADFVSHSASVGSRITRNDLNVIMAGEHARATVNGLVLIGGEQHVDNHTMLDHAAANCPSHELYKHVLDGKSTGVFKGKILVRPGAQKTDSKQTSKTLLLSDDATMNSQPALEIYADDVKCTHGSTTGPVDEEQVFYLRSRGVGLDAARHLLTYAFAADITRRIKVEPVRRRLENLMAAQHGLPQDLRITDLGAHDEAARNL